MSAKTKTIEVSQEIFRRIESNKHSGETIENTLERLIPVQEDVVDVRMKKSSHHALVQHRINNENIDSVIERLASKPVNVETMFSPDVLLRFSTFTSPGETPDQTLGRLLKIAATNSIDENLKERLLGLGRGGEGLSDIIDNLYDFYMHGTLSTTMSTYIQNRKQWDNRRAQRDSRRWLGHRWDREIPKKEGEK